MGLTIHYSIEIEASKSELLDKLRLFSKAVNERLEHPETPVDQPLVYGAGELEDASGYGLGPDGDSREELREYYRKASCTTLTNIDGITYHHPETGEEKDPETYDGMLQMRSHPGSDAVESTWEAVVLPVYVMQGCEPFTLTLGREEGTETWKCKGFTKTQYAQDFVTAHLSVVTMLDMLKELGFDVEVSDEGNYYETRDLSQLTEEFEEYNKLVADVGAMLQGMAEEHDDVEVEGSALGVRGER